MAKEETNKSERPVIDPVAFVHQPHDKYARFVLQIKEVALEMLQFCGQRTFWGTLTWNRLS